MIGLASGSLSSKKRILVMDMGSRLNEIGGQQRIAAVLLKELGKYFNTSYLGFSTSYISAQKGNIILSRSSSMNTEMRKSIMSEMWAFRFAYYRFVVRNLKGLGVKKEEVYQKVSKFNPDIIISNSIQDIVWLRYFRQMGLAFKSIYIDHATIAGDHISGYFSKEGMPITVGTGISALSMNNAKRKFFSFFDTNVALNKLAARQMKSFTNNVAYIPNGRSLGSTNNRNEEVLRKKLGIKKDDFVLLYIGRLFERQKNISTLISAFRMISSSHIKLLIVGSGPDRQRYIEMASGDHRIIFKEQNEIGEAAKAYGIADLFVLPSAWEGFSLTVLEAAEHSLPMILSKNAYIEDLKTKGIGSIPSYNTMDANELAQLIKSLAKSSKLRQSAVQSSKSINKIFTEKRMIEGYRKLIDGM